MAALNPLGPVAGDFLMDRSEVACIMGPVGSGKTIACCLRVGNQILEEFPTQDATGAWVRRSRYVVVRNTGPQLRDTTIKTWLEIFPESIYGKLVGNPPRQIWDFKPKGDKYRIYAEILFRSLDDASDVSNLLSLEVTGFYFNELKLIDEAILQHAGTRTGRAFGGGSRWHGWIADSNPWNFDSYHHKIFVVEKRPGHAFFKQPGGMEPDAENLENLAQTPETKKLIWNDPRRREQGRTYYLNALRDFSTFEADMYVNCKYGMSRDGRPCFDAYSDSAHCRLVEYDKTLPLLIGYDWSGRSPAAIVAQKSTVGQWRLLCEFIGEDVGFIEHARRLKQFIEIKFPGAMIERITGDPSVQKDAADVDPMQTLRKIFPGVLVAKARTNDPRTRIEAVNGAFRRLVNGEPAILIDDRNCKILRAACTQRYQYRKLKLSGVSEQYADEPQKLHPWSDIADATQYLLLGGGEGAIMMGHNAADFSQAGAVQPAGEAWDIFAA